MARGILADADCEGPFRILLRLLDHDSRRELWESLALDVSGFEQLGLPPDAADRLVWETCQQRELVLITANRNADHPDSLEMTIRTTNAPDSSLPVITLADPQRIARDREYAERAADRLLEYLFDCDSYRGMGRIYVP